MPTPAAQQHLIQVQREEVNRRAAHEAEIARSRGVCWGGMGPEPYTGRTAAEIRAEAQRRHDLTRSPDAVLKRSLMDAATRTDTAGDFARLSDLIGAIAALDRGDLNGADRARALLNSQKKAA